MTHITELTPRRSPDATVDRDWFWSLVEASIAPDEAEQLDKLTAGLAALSDQDLVDFIGLYQGVHEGLYVMRLWAAGYVVNGGCSDDGFIDFRAWLISRGQRITEDAVADPDSLAELEIEQDCAVFESFGYVMSHVFKARGAEFPNFRAPKMSVEPDPPGWNFDFDDADEMRRHLPRLAAKFLT